MKTRKTLSKAIALVALLAIAAVWFSARKAQAISSFSFSSGVVGVTQGQTARLNAVNALGDGSVHVEMAILDSNGKVLIQGNDDLPPGKSSLLDFNNPSGGLFRTELRGTGSVAAGHNDARGVIFTLEIFDNETGKTEVIAIICPSDPNLSAGR